MLRLWKKWKFSDTSTWWAITGLVSLFWLLSALIFSDLCLSFGGGNNSNCHSYFNYPEFLTLIAILFTVAGPTLIFVLLLVALIMSIAKHFAAKR